MPRVMEIESFYIALAVWLAIVPLGLFVIIREGYRAKRFSECMAKAGLFAGMLLMTRLMLIWLEVDWMSDKSIARSAILAVLGFFVFLIFYLIGYALGSRKRRQTLSAFRTLG